MASDVKETSTLPSQADIESHSATVLLKPSPFMDNDSAEEELLDSGDELQEVPKDRTISEKRRAQNLIFSNW